MDLLTSLTGRPSTDGIRLDPWVALKSSWHLLIFPVTQRAHQCPVGIDWAPWFLMIYLSPHKGASSTSDMLAQHHFSSQSDTATRAGPNITLDVRDLGLRSSELSGSVIVSVKLPASICQVNFLGKGGSHLVGWNQGGAARGEQSL